MKTSLNLLMLAAMLAIQACELVEENTSFGMQHVYRKHRDTRGVEDTPPPFQSKDTVIYLSAVRFPDGYDWRRDTLFGAVDAELVLMKDFAEILSIAVGSAADASADRHHILDGHLYTERHSAGKTFFGRDGTTLFSFEGKEEVRGIIEKDGVVYTLSCRPGEEGFCLRADGNPVFSRKSGSVYGSMSEPSYRPNGALYTNEGRVCFCFHSGSSLFKVEDEEETLLMSSTDVIFFQDARMVDGKLLYVGSSYLGMNWDGARIWPLDDGYALSGNLTSSGQGTIVYRSSDGSTARLGNSEAQCYVGGNGAFSIACTRDGVVSAASGISVPDGKWCMMTPSCATMGPSGPAVALTPKAGSNVAAVVCNGKETTIGINGFLTGIWISTEQN